MMKKDPFSGLSAQDAFRLMNIMDDKKRREKEERERYDKAIKSGAGLMTGLLTEFARSQPIESGIYSVHAEKDGNYVWDIEGRSKEDGARLTLWKNHGGDNQRFYFHFQRTGPFSGYYAIFCVHSWKVLDCQYSSKAPETIIWQYSHNATQAQQWLIEKEDKHVVTIKNIASENMVDIPGGDVKNGARLWMYPRNGTIAQKFYLICHERGARW